MAGHSSDIKGLLGRRLNEAEQKYAPKEVYYEGTIKVPLPPGRVSVIGTRKPTEAGLESARQIASILVKNNITVVSGLARGIDSMAHMTAINEGGRTIAVIGTPLDKAYPKENEELQKELMRHHLVISQYKTGYPVTRKNFALRNHTMALISDASVIIEAGDGSGTLYHGWEAIRLGRPLLVCRSAMQDPELVWPEKMIKYGAIEIDEPIDILEFIPSNVKMS